MSYDRVILSAAKNLDCYADLCRQALECPEYLVLTPRLVDQPQILMTPNPPPCCRTGLAVAIPAVLRIIHNTIRVLINELDDLLAIHFACFFFCPPVSVLVLALVLASHWFFRFPISRNFQL